MFLSYGIKKKDLESDVDFAFSLFKKMIVGLGSENKLKNSAVDKIEHTFLPPEEREMIRRQEEAAEAKLNIKRTQRKNKNNNISCRPSRITRCGPPPPRYSLSSGHRGSPRRRWWPRTASRPASPAPAWEM